MRWIGVVLVKIAVDIKRLGEWFDPPTPLAWYSSSEPCERCPYKSGPLTAAAEEPKPFPSFIEATGAMEYIHKSAAEGVPIRLTFDHDKLEYRRKAPLPPGFPGSNAFDVITDFVSNGSFIPLGIANGTNRITELLQEDSKATSAEDFKPTLRIYKPEPSAN